jgi:transcriptional regulator with XRE-family HTH domain
VENLTFTYPSHTTKGCVPLSSDVTVNAVRDRILTLCGERNISINKLATLCALPPSSVKNILYGKSQNPKLLTVKMICDGLDMTLAEFFDTETFNTLEPEIK